MTTTTTTSQHEDQTTTGPPVPPLTPGLKWTLGLLGVASGALAGMAFVGMFSAVTKAVRPFFGRFSWMVPVGTDLGILILSGFALWLEWAQKDVPAEKRLRLWWLRGLIWTLVGLQLGINVGSADGDPFGTAVHAVLPVLFVSILEVWQLILRWRRGLVADRGPQQPKPDRIPFARYRADWYGTREIRRHMVLWGVTSYTAALDMLQKKRRAEASLAVMFPSSADEPPQDLVFMLGTSKYLDDACAEIARMRKKFDQGANPKGQFQQHLDNIVNPAPAVRQDAAGDAGQAPECCEAHRALALKQILPLEKAAAVNEAHIAAHGSAIGADNLRLLFKIGTPNARKLRDDLKARRQSGHESGPESGVGSAPESGRESGRSRDAESGPESGGDVLAGVGSANGWPTGGGDD